MPLAFMLQFKSVVVINSDKSEFCLEVEWRFQELIRKVAFFCYNVQNTIFQIRLKLQIMARAQFFILQQLANNRSMLIGVTIYIKLQILVVRLPNILFLYALFFASAWYLVLDMATKYRPRYNEISPPYIILSLRNLRSSPRINSYYIFPDVGQFQKREMRR